MSQVTIYLDDEAEKAAREAAAACKLSLSSWFAQFAERQRERKRSNWNSFFAELDATDDFSCGGGMDRSLSSKVHQREL